MTHDHEPSRFDSLVACPPEPRVVTIGTFDGVHRGHRALIESTVDRARALGVRSTAVTFEPVPAAVLRPDRFPGRLCPAGEKIRHLADLGLDDIVTVTFDHELARQSPEEFMAAVRATGLTELWVGEAFALGRDRAGGIDRLRSIGRHSGFDVHAVMRETDEDAVISSSAIRAAVLAGDVARARRWLGRPFRVSGEVVLGARLGRTIGYPTANVKPPSELVALADGIYVSRTWLPGGTRPLGSMTYVGTRPTVNSGERLVETHLFDFDGDLYGQVIGVDMLERLRGDAVFDGLDALIAQLHSDEAAARSFLTSANDMATVD